MKQRERGESSRNGGISLSAIEEGLYRRGRTLIAGVDEAGRGPLAGPVVAAAVILPKDVNLPGLNDSKKLKAPKREELYDLITSQAVTWGVGMVDNVEIDETNILKAALKAMRIAVDTMTERPDVALVDGNCAPGLACDERPVVGGDSQCCSIAAASIIAKVTRDRIMTGMDALYPGYGFASHKGYGTCEHIASLKILGPCPIHRCSFRVVPAVSPPGTVAAVLGERFMSARDGDTFERTVSFISRIRGNLHARDLELLRETYVQCKNRFREAGNEF